MNARWPCVAAARAHDPAARLRFRIDGQPVGSVARVHLAALHGVPGLCVGSASVDLEVPAAQRDGVLQALNLRLRGQGLIRGWRDETVGVAADFDAPPLARMERAAARFWGTRTLGAHCNGYVAGADGRPQRLWIARRDASKATDPGKLDNLVGGGVPWSETPFEALVREGDEEAGLDAATMACAVAGGWVELQRDIPDGLQHERIAVFDLALPAGLQPHNRDGEVAEFMRLSIAEALGLAASEAMTVDAALVTLDFAVRQGWVDAADGVRP